jgi:signal peptidase I
MKARRWVWIVVAAAVVVALIPSYVRAYRVAGASDAPSYFPGDRVLINKAAYDIRLPYTDLVVVSHADPEVGDMVLYRSPGSELLVFKRVVGGPGDVISMRDNHLTVNGNALAYAGADEEAYRSISMADRLGSVIETEAGNGPAHPITYTPGAGRRASFEPVRVPEGHYYLIGDNRDLSEDSRAYGPVPRERVLGRLGLKLTSAR